MTTDVEFEDTIKICEFYSTDDMPIRVDYENYLITLGDYVVGFMFEYGRLVSYVVEDPDGVTLFVSDLDAYFQERLPGWEDRF